MRVVYWARIGMAKQQIIAGLRAAPECEPIIAESLPQLLQALPGAHALVLYDAPPAEAREVTQALSAPANTVRWMHFVSAGREGFDAVGLPAGVTVTYSAGAVSPACAEHAMALLLALKRRVPEMVVQTAEGRWDRGLAARATSLEGATMAIIGLDPLWTCPNVLISPHFAGGGSAASVARLVSGVVENLQRLRSGLPLLNVVA